MKSVQSCTKSHSSLQSTELLKHSQYVMIQFSSEQKVLQGHHVLVDDLMMLQTERGINVTLAIDTIVVY